MQTPRYAGAASSIRDARTILECERFESRSCLSGFVSAAHCSSIWAQLGFVQDVYHDRVHINGFTGDRSRGPRTGVCLIGLELLILDAPSDFPSCAVAARGTLEESLWTVFEGGLEKWLP